MNCHKAEELLSRAMDGELSPDERAALDAHIAVCPGCRALRDEWSQFGAYMRQEKAEPVQTAEALWADVQRTIRLQGNRQADADDVPVFGWRLRWAGAMVVAVLLGVSGVGLWRANKPVIETARNVEQGAEVEFVETDVPGASPMVYQDAETGWTVIWVAGMDESAEAGKGS